MSHRARRLRDDMELHAHPQARQQRATQTTTSGTKAGSLPPQPTAFVALSKTFSPAQTCSENRLSMMLPSFFVWVNEPVLSDGVTANACFPSEFLKSYHSVASSTFGSSIVPAMSPLACPANFCTASASDQYLVCCPSGFSFHPPETTVDTKRPAYGGTCYSDLPASSTFSVTQYSQGTSNGVIPYVIGSTSQQAYAHPIDGFAAEGETPVLGCQTPVPLSSAFISRSSSVSSAPSSSQQSTTTFSSASANGSTSSSKVSTAAVAGASIGGIAALIAVVFLVWFVLRCMRKRKEEADRPKIYHLDHIHAKLTEDKDIYAAGSSDRYETDGRTYYEMDTPEKPRDEKFRASRLNDGHGAFEMHGDQVPELDGGFTPAKKSKIVPPGYAA